MFILMPSLKKTMIWSRATSCSLGYSSMSTMFIWQSTVYHWSGESTVMWFSHWSLFYNIPYQNHYILNSIKRLKLEFWVRVFLKIGLLIVSLNSTWFFFWKIKTPEPSGTRWVWWESGREDRGEPALGTDRRLPSSAGCLRLPGKCSIINSIWISSWMLDKNREVYDFKKKNAARLAFSPMPNYTRIISIRNKIRFFPEKILD